VNLNPHPRRVALHALVAQNPGRSFRGLVKLAGIPAGTARHHLTVLERQKRVWSRRVGGRLAHFAGSRPPDERACLQLLARGRDPLDQALLDVARLGEVRGQGPFFAACNGIPRSTAQHRLARLVRDGLLTRTDHGRWAVYRQTFTCAGFRSGAVVAEATA
jgi:hypothetical protein